MMEAGWIVILDVGKTLSKASLWDEGGGCVAHRSRPNQRTNAHGSLTLDAAGIERWLEGVLKEFASLGPVRAIVPVAHGAGVALLQNGHLLCAPIDYEWPGTGADRAVYEVQRDPFVATGSPALPGGLNLGMQLHWLETLRAGNYRTGQIVPWAQYWAWFLCGVTASEVTSLGCHSDLWRPYERAPSALAVRRGWAERLAPLKPAGAVLGRLTGAWAKRTGLSTRVDVYCGLHDSNAALAAARGHEAMQGHDATVLSTGTWFVAMRSPLDSDTAHLSALLEKRDCLVNVDVSGAPVPSSRFMGGRELEMLIGADTQLSAPPAASVDLKAAAMRAVERGTMSLPGLVPGVGPFPNAKRWSVNARINDPDATAIAHVYAALIADVSLDLIGSRDTLLIDGRFSQAPVFVEALASLRPDTTVLISQDAHGVARGALRMVDQNRGASAAFDQVAPLPVDLLEYRARWREAVERVHAV